MKAKDEDGAYFIKRLSVKALSDLVTLHTAVYGKTRPLDFFFKKYDTAYTEVASVGFLAYNEKMIPIAYYGVIPCMISCGGKLILAAQSADTMTHPDYRNQGLFVKLAELTFGLCRSTGISIVFGFPNQHSLPGFIHKLGWQETKPMDCFVIPVRTVPLERIAAKFPLFRKVYVWYTGLMLRRYLVHQRGVTSSVLSEGYDGILRDANYLNYKTYTETFVIRIENTDFWLKINNGLLIGDIFGPVINLKKVMGKLVSLARMLGLKQLQYHVSTDTCLHAFFTAHYKAVPSFPVIFKDIDGEGISMDNMRFSFADIDIF